MSNMLQRRTAVLAALLSLGFATATMAQMLRELPPPALAGIHQMANAATALAAIVALGGIELTHANVSRALRAVRLPGRFQRVQGEVEWILDVAHNVPAALGLVANLRTLPRARTIAVCGILGDKDMKGIAAAVHEDVDAWVLVTLEGPRAVSTRDVTDRYKAFGTGQGSVFWTGPWTLDLAVVLQRCGRQDSLPTCKTSPRPTRRGRRSAAPSRIQTRGAS